MFHIEGSQCLVHLDQLLSMDDLDAIGARGVHVSVNGLNEADGEALAKVVDQYR